MDQRRSDDELIEVGKIVNGYTRHQLAPYAFGKGGNLLQAYFYLADKAGEDWDEPARRRINHWHRPCHPRKDETLLFKAPRS